MRRLRRLAVLLGLLALGVLLRAGPASAHAVQVGSDPADGARLKHPPASVTVRFDEPVGLNPGYLRVVDASGHRVDTGTASHPAGDGTAITVSLRSGLADGSYLASYRVVSSDTHPVAGSIRFVVGNGPLVGGGGGPSGSAPVSRPVSVLLAVSHWLSFAGIGVAGGSWLIFSLWPSGRDRLAVRRLIWTGWTVAVAGAVGEFLLQGPYAAGSGLGQVFSGSLVDSTLHLNAGQLISVRLVLLGLLGFVLGNVFADDGRRGWTWAPEAAAMVGVGIVVTYAATGHAAAAHPRWLAVLVDALHLTAMIVWLGGLAVLLVAAIGRRHTEDDHDNAELAAGLPIFSRIALACVLTLTVTGVIQAWRETRSLAALTDTRYGQLVLLKVVLFAGLIGLGYLARRVLQRPVDGHSALLRLRRGLLTEVVVGAAVLAATGVLIAQPPGNVALAASRDKPRTVSVALSGSSQARLTVDPAVHGAVRVTVRLAGGPKPSEVTATASLPARQLGPIPVPLKPAGDGSYAATGVLLPAGGDWQFELRVQTSEFDATTAVAKVKVY